MKNVIGLIHPSSARHHRSKAMCNNPDVIITKCRPLFNHPGWYGGHFEVLKKVDIFPAGHKGSIYGFRPRRIKE